MKNDEKRTICKIIGFIFLFISIVLILIVIANPSGFDSPDSLEYICLCSIGIGLGCMFVCFLEI